MTGADYQYICDLLNRGCVHSPCLEVGAGLEGANLRSLLTKHGISYYGTDIVPGPGVDIVMDLEEPAESVKAKTEACGALGTVLVANVLEHVFDPIRVLDNLCSVLRPGGTCVIITPAVWPLHSFPVDCWRILPDFYIEYACRRGLEFLDETFCYVDRGPVSRYVDGRGAYVFPRPGRSRLHDLYSRIVHRIFLTYGRGVFFPSHLALGLVLEKQGAALGGGA